MREACICDRTKGVEAKRGDPTSCSICGGSLEKSGGDKRPWLTAKIFKPRERVRARLKDNGEWEVFDGVEVHIFTNEQFTADYELAAQTQRLVKYDDGKQYEYH